jgi:hypothetical protein
VSRAGPLLFALCLLAWATACRSRNGEPPRGSPAPDPASSVRTFKSDSAGKPWLALPEATVAKERSRAEGLIWIEAEHPRATDFPKQNPFRPTEAERKVLSGGDWIGAQDANKLLFLEYQVDVPQANAFEFYTRKFWKHGPFRWRFDDAEWQVCDRDVTLLDGSELRPFVGANWVHLGSVQLGAGQHRLRIELLSPNAPAAFDVFALSAGDFVPRGKLRPTEAFPPAEAGWFTFDPALDTFRPSPLDLRPLNQVRAGDDGFIRVRGSELVFEKSGAEVRFWGINVGRDALFLPRSGMRRLARHFAKFGVNLVRVQAGTFQDEKFRETRADLLDRLHLLASELRAQGIYLGVSLYFPVLLHPNAQDGFAGYTGQSPFALQYFNQEFQALERTWWQHLLSAVNPYTGVSFAHDPGLAYVELVNEDSTLFWTFRPYETIPAAQMEILERKFHGWVTAKYGSFAQALEVWDASAVRGDDAASGRAGLLGLWEIANRPKARARDTAEFLTRLMRDHYQALQGFLKQDLGYQGLTVCSNWHTADERVLGPLDNWANSACDIMDRHAYMGGPHQGDAASYAVRSGQTFDDRSVLRGAEAAGKWAVLPAFIEPRYNGKPAFVSELGWPTPNRFRGEGPLLVSAYGRSTGLDAPMWYASANPFWPGVLAKFEAKDPASLGQFPAAALAFRRGLIAESAPLAAVHLSEADLWSLKGAPVTPETGLDGTRAADVRGVFGKAASGIEPLALLVAPIDVGLGLNAPSQAASSLDLASYIDPLRRTIRSRSGELRWNFELGQVTIQAAAINAVIGFLGEHPVELPQAWFQLGNDYASVALVALDGQPLGTSQQILLQVMTEVTNTGWSAPGKGVRPIADVGHAPLLVRNVAGSVGLTRPDASALRVTALDANGQATQRFAGNAEHITLLPNVLYYLIETSGAPPTSP